MHDWNGWLKNSLKYREQELRRHAKRCRAAYGSPGPMRGMSLFLAGVYDEAADVFSRKLTELGALPLEQKTEKE